MFSEDTWIRCYDEEGRPYYLNPSQDKASWTRPGEQFSECYDKKGNVFWINSGGKTYVTKPSTSFDEGEWREIVETTEDGESRSYVYNETTRAAIWDYHAPPSTEASPSSLPDDANVPHSPEHTSPPMPHSPPVSLPPVTPHADTQSEAKAPTAHDSKEPPPEPPVGAQAVGESSESAGDPPVPVEPPRRPVLKATETQTDIDIESEGTSADEEMPTGMGEARRAGGVGKWVARYLRQLTGAASSLLARGVHSLMSPFTLIYGIVTHQHPSPALPLYVPHPAPGDPPDPPIANHWAQATRHAAQSLSPPLVTPPRAETDAGKGTGGDDCGEQDAGGQGEEEDIKMEPPSTADEMAKQQEAAAAEDDPIEGHDDSDDDAKNSPNYQTPNRPCSWFFQPGTPVSVLSDECDI
ncbi:unnamed protein product [Vitrella brassicaformis CCMP3155]|uniref:WW domain-containing protein n=1 Tax=Vitrella brassicaformis (strain CCMP3155) TaxID=1169540 RepID=A0A0G4F6W8_VITBC|nr:unnamed protein product [Vitrella brassicaformis CCMP3155]|mmetsp:Transcript_34724/g.99991  ORF Transcript_34724/g.99991 Transcript_34724/m.99991 type:complete len:410 (+) Transcript_34724:76-1305(+)|eukprot:CEM07875.1 unnamed protein product [Vitrella brassicaformis CCMP3155]